MTFKVYPHNTANDFYSPNIPLQSITYNMNNSDLRKEIAVNSINVMLKKRHFSVCPIDDVNGVRRSSDTYSLLNEIHCHDYKDMTPNLKKHLPLLIIELLEQANLGKFRLSDETNSFGIHLIEVDETNGAGRIVVEIAPVTGWKRFFTVAFWRKKLSGFTFTFNFKAKK